MKQYSSSNGSAILVKSLDSNLGCTIIIVVKYLLSLSSSSLNVEILSDSHLRENHESSSKARKENGEDHIILPNP